MKIFTSLDCITILFLVIQFQERAQKGGKKDVHENFNCSIYIKQKIGTNLNDH